MKKILIATNGSGYQIDKCLDFQFFKDSISIIISDRECRALDVAKNHGVDHANLSEKDSSRLNNKILSIAEDMSIDFIISPGFTRIFKGDLLEKYRNRILNCHPSILPAFRGFYDTRDTRRTYPARKIFERTLEFGSLVTGNTIHVVTEHVDEGYPVIVSTLNIPYDEDAELTRHRLFVQECKTFLQVVSWLNQERLVFENSRPLIKGARFSELNYVPNLEDPAIIDFDLSYPWK